jgi:hypothetical protein
MGEDLLIQYCQDGSINEINELIETNGDNLDIKYNREEPLRISVSNLYYDIVELLLNLGADPNVSSLEDTHDSAFDLADQLNDPSMNSLIAIY